MAIGSLAQKTAFEHTERYRQERTKDSHLKLVEPRPDIRKEPNIENPQVISLRQKAKLAGEAVVTAGEELREVEKLYKNRREENIRANKTFAHLFLSQPPLGIAADEEKEAADRVAQAQDTYDGLVQERDKIRQELINAQKAEEMKKARRSADSEATSDKKKKVAPNFLGERALKIAKKAEDKVLAKEEEEADQRLTAEEKKIRKDLKRFGIKEKEFESIPGIEKLTDGQKALVLENLGQLTLGRIQAEAYDKVDQKIASSKLLSSKFLTKVWLNITKHYQIAKEERKGGKQIVAGGLKTHGEVLKQLIQGAEKGPDAYVEGDKVDIMFLSPNMLKNPERLSDEDKEKIKEFNFRAQEFAKLPADWNSTNAKESERKEYKTVAECYRFAKEEIAEILNKCEEKPGEALMGLHNLETMVTMNQYLNTHPEVEKALQNIEDEKVWTKAFQDLWAEKGLIMAGGGALRTFSLWAFGAGSSGVVIPIAGLGAGAFLSLRRSFDAMRRADQAMRRSGKFVGTPGDTLQNRFVKAGKVARKTFEGEEEETKKRGEEREPDTVSLVSKLDDLMKQLEWVLSSPHEQFKRERDPMLKLGKELNRKQLTNLIATRLRHRLDYTRKKLDAGLVSFGETPGERLVNQQELLNALSRAELSLELYPGVHSGKTERKDNVTSRLDVWLGIRERKAETAKNRYIRWEMFKGAVFGAAFAYAGKEISDWFRGEAPVEEPAKPSPARLIRTTEVTTISPIAESPPAEITSQQGSGMTEEERAKAYGDMAYGKAFRDAWERGQTKVMKEILAKTGRTMGEAQELFDLAHKHDEALAEAGQTSRESGQPDTTAVAETDKNKIISGLQWLGGGAALRTEIESITGMSAKELDKWGQMGRRAGVTVPKVEVAEGPATPQPQTGSRPVVVEERPPQPRVSEPRPVLSIPDKPVATAAPATPNTQPVVVPETAVGRAPQLSIAGSDTPGERMRAVGARVATEIPQEVATRPTLQQPVNLEPQSSARPEVKEVKQIVVPPTEALGNLSQKFFEEHAITKADGRRGLTGILEGKLPKDMPKAEKQRITNTLLALIQEKIPTMSSGELRTGGLPTGKINEVFREDTFRLGSFISESRLNDVLSGKITAVPDFSEGTSAPRPVADIVDARPEGRATRVDLNDPGSPVKAEDATSPASSLPTQETGEAPSLGEFPGTEVLPPRRIFEGNIQAGNDADFKEVSESLQEERSQNTKLSFEPERDIQLGKAYNKESYADFFRENPQALTQYNNLSRQYFEYIGGGNQEAIRRIRIKNFATLGSVSHLRASSDSTEARLGELAYQARETFGKIATPKKKEHVIEYISRVIMMSLEHPRGTTLKIPQYT